MLFPDYEITYYNKVVSKPHFYFNFRLVIMRLLRLLKRLPWFSMIMVAILLLIYNYADSNSKMDELQQALMESYRGNLMKKFTTVYRPVVRGMTGLASAVPNFGI